MKRTISYFCMLFQPLKWENITLVRFSIGLLSLVSRVVLISLCNRASSWKRWRIVSEDLGVQAELFFAATVLRFHHGWFIYTGPSNSIFRAFFLYAVLHLVKSPTMELPSLTFRTLLAVLCVGVNSHVFGEMPAMTVGGYGVALAPAPTEAPRRELVKAKIKKRDITNLCNEWTIPGGMY
jgi:hypothetical protein